MPLHVETGDKRSAEHEHQASNTKTWQKQTACHDKLVSTLDTAQQEPFSTTLLCLVLARCRPVIRWRLSHLRANPLLLALACPVASSRPA